MGADNEEVMNILASSALFRQVEVGCWWRRITTVSRSVELHYFVTLWTEAHQVSLSITDSRSLLKLMSIESVMAVALNNLSMCQ